MATLNYGTNCIENIEAFGFIPDPETRTRLDCFFTLPINEDAVTALKASLDEGTVEKWIFRHVGGAWIVHGFLNDIHFTEKDIKAVIWQTEKFEIKYGDQ